MGISPDLVGISENRFSKDELHNEKTYFLQMRKQRHRSAAADLPFCFHFINSTCTIIQIFKPLTIFRGCTAWFVSDLVRNPKDRLSHDAAQMLMSSAACAALTLLPMFRG